MWQALVDMPGKSVDGGTSWNAANGALPSETVATSVSIDPVAASRPFIHPAPLLSVLFFFA